MDLRSFNVLSICSGGGGLDLGLRLAVPATRVVCYVEHEAFACEVLATQMEAGTMDPAPIWTNLRTFDGKPWRGIVDCVIGGIPCQPHSVAGKKAGHEDPRNLWPNVRELLLQIRSPFVFFENVSNLIRTMYKEIRRDLCQLGYQVEQGIFSAEEVGAPHLRKRLFILGYNAKFDMANSDCGPLSEPRRIAQVGNGLRPTSEALENTRCSSSQRRASASDQEATGRTCYKPGGSSSFLANAQGGRRGVLWQSSGIARQSDGDGKKLDNPMRGRHECQDEEICTRRNASDVAGNYLVQTAECVKNQPYKQLVYDKYLYPPVPDEKEQWKEVIEAYPALEPAICMLANELAPGVVEPVFANRPFQLRLLGNGVVPTVAAFAFGVLLGQMFGTEKLGS